MATREEKLAAIELARSKANTPSEQFLLMWEAMVPFLPASSAAMFVVGATPTTDEQKAKAAKLQQQSLDLVQDLVCGNPQ